MSIRLEDEQKKVELLARTELLQKKQALALDRLRIQQEEEVLHLETEMAVVDARKVLD